MLLFPPFVLGPAFLVAEPGDVHHEHPGYRVHHHPTQLHDQRGPGRRQLAVEHGRPDTHAHRGKQEDEHEVHGVAQQAVVQAQPAEEPAALQQGVGDLAAEDDAARLAAWHAHEQRQQDAGDARRVVRQHDGTLAVVAHAPAHVEEEVAEAHGQGEGLELGVLRACGGGAYLALCL